MKLSVLDLMTVRTGQSTGDALAASLSLARRADELGYHRYWVAEHHNMASVGSTSPPVLIAMIASHTSRIRVGSGGVMLPNHAPLIVAEQFALLEAYAPGRIDLGIGRAPGSDPVVSAVLDRGGNTAVDDFPNNVQAVAKMMTAEGATVLLADDRTYICGPRRPRRSSPAIWLLGSSDYTASLAAALGLPYVFASHFFAGHGTERALDLYRSQFRPSADPLRAAAPGHHERRGRRHRRRGPGTRAPPVAADGVHAHRPPDAAAAHGRRRRRAPRPRRSRSRSSTRCGPRGSSTSRRPPWNACGTSPTGSAPTRSWSRPPVRLTTAKISAGTPPANAPWS